MMNEGLGRYLLEKLARLYEVTEEDNGKDAKMDKGPMHFKVKCYEVNDVGHAVRAYEDGNSCSFFAGKRHAAAEP